MNIIKAKSEDAKQLTELTIRSKAYWNYSPAQIEKWRADLTMTISYIEKNEGYILYDQNQLVGYYSFIDVKETDVLLDNFFIESTFIGRGYGKILMHHFLTKMKRQGIHKIRLESEPDAQGFYEKLGFRVIGQLESSIKNRFLPIMELDLRKTELNENNRFA